VALLGLILVTRVPPPGGNRPGSGPFLAVEDAEPSALYPPEASGRDAL
jgi:hypothetical protein